MSKKEKLIARFLGMPSDFHYDEMVKLLGFFGFEEVKKGKTSCSRVKFENGVGTCHAPQAPPKRDYEAIPNETGQRTIGVMKSSLPEADRHGEKRHKKE
ncbi:hypothetical protein [Cyclobacterium salsum]|uniref:hypothetical protein n=1 Tax=Cyclobacterium salsum TaxID=2666329 RepID=UPI001F1D8D9D|nr:hypothetical protein [Cyclobacterium salsum]